MDRKTILAFILIGAVIFLMPYYFQVVAPEQPEQPATTEPPATTTPAEEPIPDQTRPGTVAGEEPAREQTRDEYTRERVSGGQGAGGERGVETPADTVRVRRLRVETPLYTAEFSSRGATVRSWRVLPTKPYLMETEELVREQFAGRNLTLTARGGLGLLRTSERVFDVTGGGIELEPGDAPDSLVFTLPLGEGRWYRETYVFHADRYMMDVHIESRGLGAETGAVSAMFGWGGALASTEIDTSQDLYYTKAAYYIGSSKEELKSKGKESEELAGTGPTRWVAQRTKYFVMALVPDEPAEGALLATWPDSLYYGDNRPKLFETNLVLNMTEGDLDEHIQFYLGPLEQAHLSRIDKTLDEMISWGWKIIEPFSKAVFHTLVFMHKFIPNYGVILILFAIFVKVIVWPLTYKSHKSMKRMQMLQPVLKQTQEKYKDNPQRMQKEVMALYKQHKVNPMGGCWPMLLQMPLFYALFIVFRSTIELRGQPFVFWINDLSMPDVLIQLPFSIPLYGDHIALLPIVMAVSTYLQSRSTMTDPNQKFMTTLMPVMFIFLFNNFPSGLTLYYTLFNLLSWGQQKLMKPSDPELEAAVQKHHEEQEKERERAERRRRKKERS